MFHVLRESKMSCGFENSPPSKERKKIKNSKFYLTFRFFSKPSNLLHFFDPISHCFVIWDRSREFWEAKCKMKNVESKTKTYTHSRTYVQSTVFSFCCVSVKKIRAHWSLSQSLLMSLDEVSIGKHTWLVLILQQNTSAQLKL